VAGCATTTWTLTQGECIGDQVEDEEYEAYALYLRVAWKDSRIVIRHTTLTEKEPLPESELAGMSDQQRKRLREFEAESALRSFGEAGPAWKEAVASYNKRNDSMWSCLARAPRRISEPVRARGATQNVTFSRVGFDAAKTAAIFKVEVVPGEGCPGGWVVRLVKTPDEGWIVLETLDWIAANSGAPHAGSALAAVPASPAP